MVKIAGGKTGSVSRMKKQMDRSSGNRTWIKSIPTDDITVRFLTEPDDWFAYREHYSPDVHFFPCIGKDNECPGCESDSEKVQRSSRRYLANVLDVETGQVIPLKLPLDLANRLVARYERNGDTLTNRDYTLHRMGKGLDTTYDVTPEDKTPLDISKYETHDLEKALIEQYEDAFDIEAAEEVEEKTSARSNLDTDSDVELDDDGDPVPSEPSASAEEGDEGGYLTEEQALQMDKETLKELGEQLGIELDGRWSKEKMVDTLFSKAG